MNQIVELFQDNPESIIGVIAVGGGMIIALVSIVTAAAVRMSRVSAREKTRRDLAAYVAEGSISPEVAERIMASGSDEGGKKKCG